MKILSDADFVQIVLANALWVFLALLASFPAFAPRQWPLAGPGLNIKRLHNVFVPLLLAALLVWRAPELQFNDEYDLDESHFLAVAQRLTIDEVPWRSADTATSGPLNSYALTWAVPLGLPFSYLVARLTGIACLFVTLVWLLKSVSLILGRRRAPLIILSAATFYLFARDYNFVHYSSEHLPVALLSVSGWLVLALWRKPQWRSSLALGICLGAVPFTKLQAAPIAVYLFAIAMALMLFCRANRFATPEDRLRILLALIGGGLLLPAIIMVPVIATGTWSDFLRRYIENGFIYRRGLVFPDNESYLVAALNFIQITPFLLGLLGISSFLIFIKFIFHVGRFDRTWLNGLAIVGGYLIVTIFVVLEPKMPFRHYLLLLPCPLLLFTAWSMRGMGGGSPFFTRERLIAALPFLFFFICIIPQMILYLHGFHERPQLSDRPEVDPVIPAIKAMSNPGDSLAIWGCAPKYFVLTGLHSATRDVSCLNVLMLGKDFDYYRESFLSDLKASNPRFFIDTVGTGPYPYGWPHPVENARYTMYLPLAAYINSDYHLQSEITTVAGCPPVLIFIRNR